MTTPRIHLCDLTHTSQGYAAELTPYPIACIKSWFHRYARHGRDAEISLFKDPGRFIEAYRSARPGIVGFSNYMWNLDLSYQLARRVKAEDPGTLVVFGGPNFPLEPHRREAWLRKHPAVDVYLIGEGEEPFAVLVDRWLDGAAVPEALGPGLEGAHALVGRRLVQSSPNSPRVRDLDAVPSPYLEGYLDEFLKEVPLTPLLETNRGCPFTCTFCVDGIDDRTKVFRKSIERFEAELEYVASRYRGKVLTLADLNFGMYRQDVEIARVIARIKKTYDYPYHLQVSTGKNQKERVLDCAEILEGSLRLAASVQTLDPEVLANIRRENISIDQLLEVTRRANALDANSYSEVILGLPGDTREKHFSTVFRLADAGLKFIPLYTLMMLEGTQLATESNRDQWRMLSRYRVVPRCFGRYSWGDEEVLSAEIEEVCVASSTLPYEDYLECRSLGLTMGLFYQDRILFELYGFLRCLDVPPSALLARLHARRASLGEGIAALYRSFDRETHEELWDSRDELEAFTRSSPSVIGRYAAGELGNNVLFRHRATAFLELIPEIHEAAFACARELLAERDPALPERHAAYLGELREFSSLRKRDLFALGTEYRRAFAYDFEALLAEDFVSLPRPLERPVRVRFHPTPRQTAMLEDQLFVQGRDLNGIAKVISRIPVAKLQRAVEFGPTGGSSGVDEGVQFSSPTPISPGEFA